MKYLIAFNGIAIETTKVECQTLYKRALKNQCDITYKKEENIEIWDFYLNDMHITIGVFKNEKN